MSKAGLYFEMRNFSGGVYPLNTSPSTSYDKYVVFILGNGWDGTEIANHVSTNNAQKKPYFSLLYTQWPYDPDIYLITNGLNNFYIVLPALAEVNVQAFMAGVGTLNKYGTYSGGLFRVMDYRFAFNTNTGTAYAFHSVMTGEVGGYGTAPYKWCSNNLTDWDVELLWYNILSTNVGNTNVSSLATAFQPLHVKIKDDSIDLWRPVGNIPGVLCCYSQGIHKQGDIIDHQGSQYLLWGSNLTANRKDIVTNAFLLD
jgi:hypothetical protein